jgi:hypothetical protein
MHFMATGNGHSTQLELAASQVDRATSLKIQAFLIQRGTTLLASAPVVVAVKPRHAGDFAPASLGE